MEDKISMLYIYQHDLAVSNDSSSKFKGLPKFTDVHEGFKTEVVLMAAVVTEGFKTETKPSGRRHRRRGDRGVDGGGGGRWVNGGDGRLMVLTVERCK
ncbi:hypothetical protein HanIR_Chr01g0050711 [Helianthus annuus]|nr:hypothetical protein HanIR_Chr01g0050711 [Helianthus annuus]